MSELKNKTIKGIFWSGAFSIINQGLALFFSIIIARLLSPSDYGMTAMLTIFTTIATVLQESGYVMVLTNKKEVTHKEYCTVFWFNVIISFIVYLILFHFAPFIATFYNRPELLPLSRYVFLGFFISSFGIVQNAYLFKHIKVKEKGIINITSLTVSGIVGIIMAIKGFSFWGLATQGLLNTLISTIAVWFYSPFRPSLQFDGIFLKSTISDGIRFAIPNIFSVISNNIYSVILGKLYTPTNLGIYSQGNKFNVFGYSFILGILRNVTQPVLVQVKSNSVQFLVVFRKLYRFTLYISFPVMIGMSFISFELISFLLTDKWLDSAFIMKILSVSGFFIIISTLNTYALTSLNKTRIYMWLGIINSIINLVVATIASLGGIISLAFATVLSNFFILIMTFIIINRICHYQLKNILYDTIPVLLIGLLSIFITHFITINIEEVFIRLIAKLLFTLILYITFSSLLKINTFYEIKEIIRKKFHFKI